MCATEEIFYFFLSNKVPAETETALWFSDNEWMSHQRYLHFANGMKKHKPIILSSDLGPPLFPPPQIHADYLKFECSEAHTDVNENLGTLVNDDIRHER